MTPNQNLKDVFHLEITRSDKRGLSSLPEHKNQHKAMSKEDIKPCPKCGSPVRIDIEDNGNKEHGEVPSYRALCTECGFTVGFLCGERYRRSAIADWHRYLKNRKEER